MKSKKITGNTFRYVRFDGSIGLGCVYNSLLYYLALILSYLKYLVFTIGKIYIQTRTALNMGLFFWARGPEVLSVTAGDSILGFIHLQAVRVRARYGKAMIFLHNQPYIKWVLVFRFYIKEMQCDGALSFLFIVLYFIIRRRLLAGNFM